MKEIDLSVLSLAELKKLEKEVAKAIATFEERQKAEARAEAEMIAKKFRVRARRSGRCQRAEEADRARA